MPAYLIRFSFFGAPLTLLEIFIYILFIIWLFQFKEGRRIHFDIKIWVPILLLFYGATVSTVFSSNLIVSVGIWKGYFLDPLLFFVIFIDVFRRMDAKNQELKIHVLLRWFLFSGYFVAMIAFAYLLFGKLTYDGRLSAFYLSPNHLAMFLAPVFLVNLYFFFKASGIKKAVLFLGMAFIVLLLYATGSSGAWIGLTVGISLWLFLKYRIFLKYQWLFNRKTAVCFFVFSVFLSAAIILKLPAIADYFDDSGRSSLHSRLMIWRSATDILSDNWILGIGPGMFQEYYLEYQKYFTPYLEWAVPQPHNIFLAFWLQTGIMGIIGFIHTIIMLYSRIIIKNYMGLYWLIISFLTYFLVHGLVDTIYWKNDLALIFWFFAGIISIVSYRRDNDLQ
ncbi:MAG: O-antigen ligase family protein [Patescibacteria group bacterium]